MKNEIVFQIKSLFRNRVLIWEFTRREIFDKYTGHVFGAAWSFLHPAVLILVYIFLFGIVFNSRIHFTENMPQSFTSYILSGMVPWLCIQTAMNNGCSAIISNSKFIKQVVFPAEIFPAKAVGAALFIEVVYLILTLAYNIIMAFVGQGAIIWTYLLLPVAIIIQTIFLLGLSFLFSTIGAYFRDFREIVQVFCMIGVYLAPIVYLPDAIPTVFRPILYINPFSYYIWVFQDVLYFGHIVHWYAWIVTTIISFAAFVIGFSVFSKGKTAFGSVL
jgi:lipopolysaccharide transport system permease protein